MIEIQRPTFEASDPDVEASNPESWVSLRRFLSSRNRGAYLWGPCGTGKTFGAECILAQVDSVSVVTAPEFVRIMRLFSPGESLKKWKFTKILLLDDIDKANWKPADVRSLWEVLNARMKAYKLTSYTDHPTEENTLLVNTTFKARKTIITGNVQADELRSFLTNCADGNITLIQSLFQRLHPIQVMEFKGKSLR